MRPEVYYMKFIRFLLLAAFVLSLTACVGGGSKKSSVNDDTRVLSTVKVDDEGKLSYVGSGDLEGFELNIDDPALAGRTIYIEKSAAAYVTGGYVAVSDKYSVRLTDAETSVDTYYEGGVTVPYSSSMLAAEGGTAADVSVCSIINGVVVASATTAGSGAYVTSGIDFPVSFFAGYRKVVEFNTSGVIQSKGLSYASADSAGDYLQDPAGTLHPDVLRGLFHIQPGEKILLGINEAAYGDTVADVQWSITSKPAGSTSALTADGDDTMLIPDVVGTYIVQAEILGGNGQTTEESANIEAQAYSYNAALGDAYCYFQCHTGTFSPSTKDQYGRTLFRDIVSMWQGTAHSTTFNRVSGSVDSACFKCHTTGFLYADRDNNGTDEYSIADGYDDTIGAANWGTPAVGDAHLRNVTCEACHGPTSTGADMIAKHYSNTSLSSDTCLACHDHGNIGGGHFFEYSDAHDKAFTLADGTVASTSACAKCHTGEGMMGRIFGVNINTANRTDVTGVTCNVCHEPHGEGGNNAQLRLSGTYEIDLADGTLTANAGDALICYNCHNADMQLPAVGVMPHNSQAEMFQGVGGYDYGEDLNRYLTGHSITGVTCNDCHMNRNEGVTHQMLMTENTADRLIFCSTPGCHVSGLPEFTDGHFDRGGKLAGIRVKIDQLADTINSKAGFAAGTAISASYAAADSDLKTALDRAAYNYNFIKNDRSFGFHNPSYAEKLIDLSLADLANY
jgi:hypothetical protein